jgi:hypothetical protein
LPKVSGASNEKGLFLGADVRWTRRWQINAYADVWRHPWLRYGVNAPSAGHEYLARVQWQKGKYLLQVRGGNRKPNRRTIRQRGFRPDQHPSRPVQGTRSQQNQHVAGRSVEGGVVVVQTGNRGYCPWFYGVPGIRIQAG